MNGVRRTPSEIKRFAEDVDSVLLVGEFKDDLTNYGLTTVIGGRYENNAFKADIWVMSCRTFDRYLEHAMLLALQKQMSVRSVDNFGFDFKRTGRNDYFVATCVGLGLFKETIKDGDCQVDAKKMVIPAELPMKVVFR